MKLKTVDDLIKNQIKQLSTGEIHNWVYGGPLDEETIAEIDTIIKLHQLGIITTGSQANLQETTAKYSGWGFCNSEDETMIQWSTRGKGLWYQRAYVCMFVPKKLISKLRKSLSDKIVIVDGDKRSTYNVTFFLNLEDGKIYKTTWVGTERFDDWPYGKYYKQLKKPLKKSYKRVTVLEPDFTKTGSLFECILKVL